MDTLQLKYRLQSSKTNFKFLSKLSKSSINRYVLFLICSLLSYFKNNFDIIKISSCTSIKKSRIHICTQNPEIQFDI